jgi:hypothetical protein
MPLNFFLWEYVNDTVYKIPVTSLYELKLRIVTAIETVTSEMLEIISRETEYRLDILFAKKGAHVEVVWHSAVLILYIINIFGLQFNIP